MLTFLRRIRRRLLTEGNPTAYLLYAIGEIALVVIGILIALQIDNWNSVKKERQLELELLGEIRVGLQDDLEKAKGNLEFQNEITKCQEVMIDWFESPHPFHDSLSYYLSRAILYSRFLPNSGSYETLKQIGSTIITNDSLRNQITFLYEVEFVRYRIELADYKELRSTIWSLLPAHFEEMAWFEPLRIIDETKFKSDQELLFHFRTTNNGGELIPFRVTPRVIRNIEATLQMLDEEIG